MMTIKSAEEIVDLSEFPLNSDERKQIGLKPIEKWEIDRAKGFLDLAKRINPTYELIKDIQYEAMLYSYVNGQQIDVNQINQINKNILSKCIEALKLWEKIKGE